MIRATVLIDRCDRAIAIPNTWTADRAAREQLPLTLRVYTRLILTDKHSLSERVICSKFIRPALRKAGWDEMLQIREEVGFTKGRIIARGKLVYREQPARRHRNMRRLLRNPSKLAPV